MQGPTDATTSRRWGTANLTSVLINMGDPPGRTPWAPVH